MNLLLSHANIKWENDTWLDTGILFPFYYKQLRPNIKDWVDYLIHISKNYRLCTTYHIIDELKRNWDKNPNSRKRANIKSQYDKLLKNIDIADISNKEEIKTPGLSFQDWSLVCRPNGLLVTSDNLLYQIDKGPTIIVKLNYSYINVKYQLIFEKKE